MLTTPTVTPVSRPINVWPAMLWLDTEAGAASAGAGDQGVNGSCNTNRAAIAATIANPRRNTDRPSAGRPLVIRCYCSPASRTVPEHGRPP